MRCFIVTRPAQVLTSRGSVQTHTHCSCALPRLGESSFKHDLSLESTRHELALRSQIDFRERQLSECYGPIYALLKRIRPIDNLRQEGKLRDIDAEAIKVIRESNDRIADIILNKSHLIRGDKIPESYTRYLLHVAVWHAFLNTPHRGFPDPKKVDVSEAYYVKDFEEEVFQTTESLKRELFELYQHYGIAETANFSKAK